MKIFVFGIALALSGAAHAQTYPNKPIRLVVPFAPGGSSTIVARSVAMEMEKGLGQPIVIENVTGANGTIGVGKAVRAAPDGYTTGSVIKIDGGAAFAPA